MVSQIAMVPCDCDRSPTLDASPGFIDGPELRYSVQRRAPRYSRSVAAPAASQENSRSTIARPASPHRPAAAPDPQRPADGGGERGGVARRHEPPADAVVALCRGGRPRSSRPRRGGAPWLRASRASCLRRASGARRGRPPRTTREASRPEAARRGARARRAPRRQSPRLSRPRYGPSPTITHRQRPSAIRPE